MNELRCEERMNAVKAGMATISPVQLQTIFTHRDMELRTCGLPEVNIEFLKVTFKKILTSKIEKMKLLILAYYFYAVVY